MNARAKARSSSYTAAARAYAERVVAGEILACQWVQRACQRQLDDLAKFKGKASPYLFNPKLTDKDGRSFQPADNLCAFIERLPHVKGPLAGEPIQLEPWQAFILTTVFGWVKPNGTRRFRRSYIEVPRGNAKSTLSSAVALYMLAADREGGAEVYSLATTRDQARIVFGDAQTMARRSPGFRRRFSVEVGAHNMHVLASGSKFEALSAEGSTLDGLNIHFGCVDEPALSRSISGMRVSADSAMRLAAVYACVRILSETMASLPLVVYRPRKDGGKDRVTDHWLEFPGTFEDPEAKRVFRESYQAAQSGSNRGKVLVLENGMKFHEVGVTNKDAQFLELRKFQITDIARLFRVPPHMIADLDRATFSNIEQQSLEFVIHTMTPWAERWEASIEADLLPDGDALEIEFDFANLM